MGKKNTALVALVKDRILMYMKARDMSFYKLSLLSGVSEIGLRNWYSERNYAPSLQMLEKVCSALKIYPYELFCQDEDLLPVSKEKRIFLEKLDCLPKKHQEAIMDLINSLAD